MVANADSAASRAENGLAVGDLVIDLGRRQVLRAGNVVPMAGLTFDLLVALARAAPSFLSYDQLIDRVWPGLVVNPETVTQRVKLLRDALEDDPRAPRYVTGVRGHGYRMLGQVTLLQSVPKGPEALIQTPSPEHALAAMNQIDARDAVQAHWPRQLPRRGAAAVALAVLLSAAAIGYFRDRDRSAAPSSAPPAASTVEIRVDRTIAVLPFANVSGDASYEYFSDGLTEELINRLTGVPELHVAARTSSFHFKNRSEPARAIGKQLGVRHLLEGSVRRSGDTLRITAQLTNAETGYQLWSQRFDRPLADVFAIQDEIALAVVEGLRLTLQNGARTTLARHGTRNPEALDLYLRARHLHQSIQLDRIARAIEYYEQVLRLDPRFAAAYVGIADAIMFQRQIVGRGPDKGAHAEIVSLLRKALDVDPSLGDAHAVLGNELGVSLDIAGSERELKIAERLSPNSEYVLRYLAQFYAGAGGWPQDKSIEYAVRGQKLDPLNPWAITNVGLAYWHTHRYKAALQQFDTAIEVDPQFWVAHWFRSQVLTDLDRHEEALASSLRTVELNRFVETRAQLGIAYAYAGRTNDARNILAELRDPGASPYRPPTWEGRLLFALGDRAGALDAFERAYDERDWQLVEALHYRSLLPLHTEARFQRLIKLLGQERHAAYAARLNQAAH